MTDIPRIAMVSDAHLDNHQRQLLAEQQTRWGKILLLVRVLVRNSAVMERFMRLADVFYSESTLTARDRELIILRVGYETSGDYAVTLHERRGLRDGLTPEEIIGARVGPGALCWKDRDRTLLAATNELLWNLDISDETWSNLTAIYSDEQIIEFIMLVGTYRMLSGFTRSARLPNEII